MISLSQLQRSVENFTICLTQERYFDAHEAIESLWFPFRMNSADEIKLLRAYINAAVSFELHKRGRYKPSERVWENFLKYQPLLKNIDIRYKEQYKIAEKEILKTRKKLI